MDLKLFFSPVPHAVYQDIDDSSAFFNSIHIFSEQQPDFKGANIAIIGLEENRGAGLNDSVSEAANEIRKKLYRLKKGSGTYRIIDLGNLRKAVTLEESIYRLREVCATLINHDVLPVVIGGSHDHSFGQYLAYEHMDKLVNLLIVDAFLDMEEEELDINNKNHIHKLLMHDPNFLFNISLIGYQSYLIDRELISMLEKLYFDAYRLGQMRNDFREIEPLIRDSDLLSFDITSIKSADAPGNVNAQPFGLTGEEACQICWYAGLNEKLSSVGFYEYNPAEDDKNKKTASVVATMVWYFVEGFYHRKDEHNFRGNDYLKYVVSMPVEPETLVFYKSKGSEKWWIEVPYPQGNFQYDRNLIVPCNYSDYQLAQQGEIPEKWILMQNKLI